MPEVEINFSLDVMERLEIEISHAETRNEAVIGEYLKKQFSTDSVLKNAYYDRKITLKAISNYVVECANKELGGKNGYLSDDVVFGWVLHYVQDENVKVPEKESFKLTKEDENEAKAKAMKRFEEEELEKIRKAEQKKKEALEKKAIKEKLKEEEERGKQLSLFDF